MRKTKIKSIVFCGKIVLGIRLFILPYVELRVLSKLIITTIVRIAPRFP